MNEIRFSGPVTRSPTAVTAEIDGQMVALDAEQGVCYGLNRVATRIWALLEEHDSPELIVDQLCSEYEVDPETCRAQTIALLSELAEAGLVSTPSMGQS